MSKIKKIKENQGIILILLSYVITLVSIIIYIFKLFNPYHVILAVGIYLLNWAVFLLGAYKVYGRYLQWVKKRKKVLIIIIFLLIIASYFVYALLPIDKNFDKEYGTDKQEFNFVYFLEGSEEKKIVEIKHLAAFRSSWQKFKRDIMQK